MVLFSPLAHAILHDARDAYHKTAFIQTVTTCTIVAVITVFMLELIVGLDGWCYTFFDI